jgi:hypothetical protein
MPISPSENVFLSAMSIINYGLLLIWMILAFISIVRMRQLRMTMTENALWMFVIAIFPVIGAVAFLVVMRQPQNSANGH